MDPHVPHQPAWLWMFLLPLESLGSSGPDFYLPGQTSLEVTEINLRESGPTGSLVLPV